MDLFFLINLIGYSIGPRRNTFSATEQTSPKVYHIALPKFEKEGIPNIARGWTDRLTTWGQAQA